MNRRKLLQSFLSLAALAFMNPMKLLASCDPSETKEIKIAEGPCDLITLHNLQPQHQYTIRAGYGTVKLSCLNRPVTLKPGHAVVITPTENGGWNIVT